MLDKNNFELKIHQSGETLITKVFAKWSRTFSEFSEFRETDNH